MSGVAHNAYAAAVQPRVTAGCPCVEQSVQVHPGDIVSSSTVLRFDGMGHTLQIDGMGHTLQIDGMGHTLQFDGMGHTLQFDGMRHAHK